MLQFTKLDFGLLNSIRLLVNKEYYFSLDSRIGKVGCMAKAKAQKLIAETKFSARHISLSLHYSRSNSEYGPTEVQRSKLSNGIQIAAAKSLGAQMTACTIMYQAGSRYEKDNQIGASHFIRTMAGSGGCGYTSFMKTRFLHQHGAYITCSSNRQAVAYTLRCPLPVFKDLKNILLDTAARCCYNQWEIEDRRHIVEEDLTRITPEQLVIDLVQQAAWSGGLSRSVFCEEERLATMSENDLNCFVNQNFKSNCCTVASVGVPWDEMLSIAENIQSTTNCPPERSVESSRPKSGFEFYDLGPNSDTWIAVVVPGAGTSDLDNMIKHNVIASACGTGNIEIGQHAHDRIPQPPLGLVARGDIYTEYRAFNISYAETGLFGIVAKTKANSARHVALAAAQFLAHVKDLDVNQIQVGKQRLKVNLCFHDDDCVQVSESLALQLANKVKLDSAKDIVDIIDYLPWEDISRTAQELSNKFKRMSVAVVGDVGAVPNDRELISCSS